MNSIFSKEFSQIALLSILLYSFALASVPTITGECQWPTLRDRLLYLVDVKDPVAFQKLLSVDCFEDVRTDQRKYDLLSVIISRPGIDDDSMTKYVKSFIRFGCTAQFLATISNPSSILPMATLDMLKKRRCKPSPPQLVQLTRSMSSYRPQLSFLMKWIMSRDRKSISSWPFANEKRRQKRGRQPVKALRQSKHIHSSLKPSHVVHLTKSEDSPIAASRKDISSSSPRSPLNSKTRARKSPIRTDEIINDLANMSIVAQEPQIPIPPPVNLHFGHCFGWIGAEGSIPAMSNDNSSVFDKWHHSVALNDRFLGLTDRRYHLKDFLKAFKNPECFFRNKFKGLYQRIVSNTWDFAACRVLPQSSELEAIVQGDMELVVLGRDGEDNYSFKYPSNPYSYFLESHPEVRVLKVPVQSSDIVILINRRCFVKKQEAPGMTPHDLIGSFYFSELACFHLIFQDFLKFLHQRSLERGILAVGGYIFDNSQVR